MARTVIQVDRLSKAYRIGKEEKKSDTLAAAMLNAVKAPLKNFHNIRNLRNYKADEDSIFWALKDVSFDVQEGEVLGIVGHNGAGKSTLLKILSRITEPSSGRITITGRVSSLLEVGTGFHPDLTGRENIYMNGTILGMRKREIDSKLDEIIAFSGITSHIDTPVKRYSSGMTVRLAFSVAAHLEPEILIIDEVLAVGDAEFQKKCLGKMNAVAKQGRTVLFVSHNMPAVQTLCTRGLLLAKGSVKEIGAPSDIIVEYLRKFQDNTASTSWSRQNDESKKIFFTNIAVRPTDETLGFVMGTSVIVDCEIISDRIQSAFQISIQLTDENQQTVCTLYNTDFGINSSLHRGLNRFSFVIENLNLLPGIYFFSLKALYNYGAEVFDICDSAVKMDWQLSDVTGIGIPMKRDRGLVWFKMIEN